ncbi:hypothetical protein ABZ858_18140 [Streptomyces sp. NPDC047017]|uniref:hypothetical protein n=1 Tax=Streptomyces sp. NPDC047017 TaxID=3155024 RepID=UPI0033F3F3B4
MPDQQAQTGEDPWEVAHVSGSGKRRPGSAADDVPDTDEAGSGPQGAPRSGTAHPEHPAPQEPSD